MPIDTHSAQTALLYMTMANVVVWSGVAALALVQLARALIALAQAREQER